MKKYFVPLFFVLLSCGNHLFDDVFDETLDDAINNALGTGLWSGETLSSTPKDILIGTNFSNVNAASLPKSVSLEDKFPPVQSQGEYGTCGVWSAGYAFKTALNAIEKNWSPADLENPSNQTSPKDLWLTIPNSRRGIDCNGTAFGYAMDALIVNGAASMAEVPYDMKSSCNESPSQSKGNPNNKLANYRKIADIGINGKGGEGMNVENFKNYLAQGRPVLFGATIGERFRKWKDNSVISSDYNIGGGHGMVLVGYDDSKGTDGAFRVRNSWGTKWGDNGSIWVDYNFFLTNFCDEAYVAQNPNSPSDPVNPPAPNTNDLLVIFAEDYHDPKNTSNPRARAFYYQVYNNGSTEILASQRWGVWYMYYNAYDADDSEIIFEDYYTDQYGKPCTKPEDVKNKICWGKYNSFIPTLAGALWNNINIKPGKIAGEEELGEFEIPYEMPKITGDYYLLVYADYMNVIKESNEDNNFYFIGDEFGKPLKFINGVQQSTPANTTASALAKRSKRAPVHSLVDLGELNAYTPQEIKTMLDRDRKNGVLAKKIAKYREANPVKRTRQ